MLRTDSQQEKSPVPNTLHIHPKTPRSQETFKFQGQGLFLVAALLVDCFFVATLLGLEYVRRGPVSFADLLFFSAVPFFLLCLSMYLSL